MSARKIPCAAARHLADGVDQRIVKRADALGPAGVAALVQVLVVEQRDRFAVFQQRREGMGHKLAHGLGRIAAADGEIALAGAQLLVHALERRDKQALLAAEIVVEHVLGQAAAARDRVDARALIAARRELRGRASEDPLARLVRVRAGLAHGAYSMRTPAALTTSAHLARSVRAKAAKASGVIGAGSPPTFSSAVFTPGSPKIRFTSAAILSTMARGVAAGA